MNRKIILLLLCAMLCTATAAEASAYTAYSYGTDYGDGVNTRGAAQMARDELSSMGYNPANYVQDPSSVNAYNNMANAQVWFFNGHGNAGCVYFKTGGESMYITANTAFPYAISGYSGGQLNDLAFAAYIACNTANSGSWGNLLDESVNRGIDTALGFPNTIDARSNCWEQRFSYYLDERYSINDAAHQAAISTANTYWPFGDGGTGNYVIRGSSSATIDPARAGY